ncbi:MAG TPA: GtrA family protein [Streptosporangiaceae bacterium]
MTLVGKLYRQFQHLIHEMAKFGVVGGLGFIVTEVGFNVLHFDVGLGLFTSNAIATGLAMIVTYVGNRWWTFRHRGGHGTTRETVSFIVLNLGGLLIQYACVWTAKNVFGLTDRFTLNVAFLIGIGLGTLFRFWSYRKWVWLALPGGPEAGEEPVAAPPGPPPGGHEAREPELVPPAPQNPDPGYSEPDSDATGPQPFRFG